MSPACIDSRSEAHWATVSSLTALAGRGRAAPARFRRLLEAVGMGGPPQQRELVWPRRSAR